MVRKNLALTEARFFYAQKESKTAGYNFCHSCGRTSTLKNIQKHLACSKPLAMEHLRRMSRWP